MMSKTFVYEVVDCSGFLVKGQIELDNADVVATLLVNQQFILLLVDLAGQGLHCEFVLFGFCSWIIFKDLVIFLWQFVLMIGFGFILFCVLVILED